MAVFCSLVQIRTNTSSSSYSGPVLSRVWGEQGEQKCRHSQCQTERGQLCTTRGLNLKLNLASFIGRWGGEVDVIVARGRVTAASAFLSTASILWRARKKRKRNVKNRLVWWHLDFSYWTEPQAMPRTIDKWDVVASVSSLKPTGHFLQHCYLPPNHYVWFGDVNFHIWIRHLIG